MHQRRRWGWLLALPLMLVGVQGAETLSLPDGRTFREATVRRLDDDRLVVEHAGGQSTLFFHEVPEALRRRLGYDSEAALRRLTLEVFRLRGVARGGATPDANPGTGTEPVRPRLLEPVAVPAPPSASQAGTTASRAERWAGLEPPARATGLAPVGDGQVIGVWELVNHYRSDPSASDARYRKRSFRVTGVVERMERGLVSRNVRVFLETPDPAVRPVCEWRIDDKIPAFHTRRDGRTLVAENNRSRWKLLEAGQTVTFEVRCDGLEDGLVELKGARLQP
ncbi:MAG: hypothetical protein FJ396_12105 [Verrucomicrobia bacterium]|nr:hypothetical protein [Verrucomicrobiota bacterium]